MDTHGWVPENGERLSHPAISDEFALAPRQGAGDQARSDVADLGLSSEDLEDALSIARMGVWRWEVGTDAFAWSHELFRIAGRDPHLFTPTLESTLACIHTDDRAQIRARLFAAVESHDPLGREFRIVQPDGSERYCWARISPITRNGRVEAIRGVLLDLTERRLADIALEASEEHFRNTVELSPQMPWTADAAGNVLTISGRWSKITGLPESAALGAGWLQKVYEGDRPAVMAAVAASLATGAPLDVKARLQCASGELRWLRSRAFPKTDAQGRIARWYGLSEDVHDQELTLARLRESEEHYRYTVELNPQIPWTADPQGNILDAGPRWSELIGTEPQRWVEALHPDDVTPTTEQWTHSLRTGERVDLRYRLKGLDGNYKWCRVRAGPRHADTGEILRWYGVVEDIDDQVKIETTMRAHEKWIRDAHEAAGIGLFEVDFREGVTRLSRQSLVLHGRSPDADPVFPGASWATLLHPEDGANAWAAVEQASRTGDSYDCTFRVVTPDGTMRWINGLGGVEFDNAGEARRLLGINLDVTARRTAETSLHESEALNRSIVNASPDSIKLISPSGEILFANLASQSAMETDENEGLVGCSWVLLWPKTARDQAREAISAAVHGGMGRFTAPRPSERGRPRWFDVVVSPVLGESGTPLVLAAIARDVTDQKTAQDRINWSASHDSLTRLPNRGLFESRLIEALALAETAGEGLALFVLDVDHFKHINDTLGHDAGDAVLRTLSDRLRATVRPMDTVARLGGDEFALILPGVGTNDEAVAIAERLLEQLRMPVSHAGVTLDCRASIGASIFPTQGETMGDLLKHADLALYAAKASRRGEFLIFAPHMRAELLQRVSMTNIARVAVQHDRIRAFYQPKVDLRTGRLAGFEALARWVDTNGEVHLPEVFAAAFEDHDVSTALTRRMLDQVVAQMRDWSERGLDFGHVALNASTVDLQRPDFGDVVLQVLHEAGVEPARMQLEVTETVFLARGADRVERTLRTLNREGIRIALDDFGTGYASLSHLKQFPVDIIKIDRSFVSDIGLEQQHSAIAEAVITLGRNLRMEVVAEGIETAGQAGWLLDVGCHYGQGFLFSPAVPAETLGDLSRTYAPACIDRAEIVARRSST